MIESKPNNKIGKVIRRHTIDIIVADENEQRQWLLAMDEQPEMEAAASPVGSPVFSDAENMLQAHKPNLHSQLRKAISSVPFRHTQSAFKLQIIQEEAKHRYMQLEQLLEEHQQLVQRINELSAVGFREKTANASCVCAGASSGGGQQESDIYDDQAVPKQVERDLVTKLLGAASSSCDDRALSSGIVTSRTNAALRAGAGTGPAGAVGVAGAPGAAVAGTGAHGAAGLVDEEAIVHAIDSVDLHEPPLNRRHSSDH